MPAARAAEVQVECSGRVPNLEQVLVRHNLPGLAQSKHSLRRSPETGQTPQKEAAPSETKAGDQPSPPVPEEASPDTAPSTAREATESGQDTPDTKQEKEAADQPQEDTSPDLGTNKDDGTNKEGDSD